MAVDRKTFEQNFLKAKILDDIGDSDINPGFIHISRALRDIGIVLVNIRDTLIQIAQHNEQI